MIAIKSYLVLKMFPNKPSKGPETIGYDLLKDVERIRDNVPQDTSSDIILHLALGSPSYMQNQESEDFFLLYFFNLQALLQLFSSIYCST